MKTIGIVIPAYNEKENILKLIKGIRRYLNCVILVVDDSYDKSTQKILSKSRVKSLKYFNRGKKSGRGSAVIFGFKKLVKKRKISCFVEMDADLSHSPTELKRNIFFYKNFRSFNWEQMPKIIDYKLAFIKKGLIKIIKYFS